MSHQTEIVVFIDYDNLLQSQKSAGIHDIVTKTLIQLPLDYETHRLKCDVRIYGGWYEGIEITRLAQDVTIEIQKEFPTIIRIPVNNGKYVHIPTNAELAVSLMKEPGHHLFNTFRRRGKVGNIRVEVPSNIGCVESDCILPLVKKLMRNGKCPKLNCCTNTDRLVYRAEQKIVDTMLSCDLIHASSENKNMIILISSDDDFLPPLRTIILNGTKAVRFHPKQNNQRAVFPHGGVQLVEMDL